MISILLTGILAANLEWMWIFYIEGLLCLIWCTAWWVMIADSPEEQTRFISQEEKNYIMESLGHTKDEIEHEVYCTLSNQLYIDEHFSTILLFLFPAETICSMERCTKVEALPGDLSSPLL